MGQRPAVIDSRELLLDPGGVLDQLCTHLGVAFDSGMLEWPSGPRADNGIWAPHWYDAVHLSTGFAAYQEKTGFPGHLQPLLEECRPYYDDLYARAIRATRS